MQVAVEADKYKFEQQPNMPKEVIENGVKIIQPGQQHLNITKPLQKIDYHSKSYLKGYSAAKSYEITGPLSASKV